MCVAAADSLLFARHPAWLSGKFTRFETGQSQLNQIHAVAPKPTSQSSQVCGTTYG
jgi:hypothetical protein